MKKVKNRFLSVILSMAVIISMVVVHGDFTVRAAVTEHNIVDGSIRISSAGSYYIKGAESTTENTITVNANMSGDVYITIDNVHISTSGCAFSIGSGSTVYLTLKGDNNLKSGGNYPGINVPSGAALYISEAADTDGMDSLTVAGGTSSASGGAGIGGSFFEAGGRITINGGNVTAIGGGSTNGGAGIGGGYSGAGGTITINGGNVRATGGDSTRGGAGIGGGNSGAGGTITINGGDVRATGGGSTSGGAGIGSGAYHENQGSCTIIGGSVSVSTMGPVPTDENETVYRTIVNLSSPINTPCIYMVDDTGPSSCTTDENGKLYLWLPQDQGVDEETTLLVKISDEYYKAKGRVQTNNSNSFVAEKLESITPVEGVRITPDVKGLSIKGEMTLRSIIEPIDATDKSVTWRSSDTSVATVTRKGKVRSVHMGHATITAVTTDGNFSSTCNITVLRPTAEDSTVDVDKTTVAADGEEISTITVTLKDSTRYMDSGWKVALKQEEGNASIISPKEAITDKNGQATFEVRSTKAETVTYTAIDVTDNITLNQKATITFIPGKAASMTVSGDPVPGKMSGEKFDSQFEITLKDKFENICTTGPSASATVSAGALNEIDGGSWKIGGTTEVVAANGVAIFEDLTCTQIKPGTGKIKFTYDTVSIESTSFTIPAKTAKILTPDTSNNTIDNDIEIKFDEDMDFADAITEVYFKDIKLESDRDYEVSSSRDRVTLKPSGGNSVLTTSSTGDVVIIAKGYKDSTVEQTIKNGAATCMVMIQDIKSPRRNGRMFEQQPVIMLKDKYGNICTNDNTTKVIISVYNSSDWTLTGTKTVTAQEGIATFTDLGVSNVTAIDNGQIVYSSDGLAAIISNAVTLPKKDAPLAPNLELDMVGDGEVTLSWDEIDEATGYKIYHSLNSGFYSNEGVTVTESVYSYNVTGLTNGNTYYFVVTSVNPGGESSHSNEVGATPQVLAPGVPILNSADVGDGYVDLTWKGGDRAIGYKIYKSLISDSYGNECATVSDEVYSYKVTGLTNGTTYYFVVKGINPGGESGYSNEVSGTPRVSVTVPGTPTGVIAVAGREKATVSFIAPYDGGSPITHYIVTSNPGGITATGSSSPITITGLTERTQYTFTVTAINRMGAGGESTASNTVTPIELEEDSDDDDDSDDDSNDDSSSRGTSTEATQTYKAVVEGNNTSETTILVSIDEDLRSATVDVGILIENLFKPGETKVIRVSSIPKVNAYTIKMPVFSLEGSRDNSAITFSTELGTITIPNNMVSHYSEIQGKEVSITIGQGDKSTLHEEVKAAIGNRPLVELTLRIDGKQTNWNNPYGPITVSIPYTPTEEELADYEHILVWYIDSYGNPISVPSGRYNPETGMVTFNTTHFSHYTIVYEHKTFNDLSKVEWARKSIEVLSSKGILKSISEGQYMPKASITRGDFLYSLIRTLGVDADFEGNFDDINRDAYYYEEIGIAKNLGITMGMGNNKYGPDTNITRQDMMVLTHRALIILGKVEQRDKAYSLDRFADKSLISAYALNSVASMVGEGLIEGSAGHISPLDNTSRAETAAFLYKIYNKF